MVLTVYCTSWNIASKPRTLLPIIEGFNRRLLTLSYCVQVTKNAFNS